MTTQTIREIWRRELELDDIADDDDFFDLGGHSLIMAKIQEDLAKELGVDVPMDDLFRHSTIKSISAHLESQTAATA